MKTRVLKKRLFFLLLLPVLSCFYNGSVLAGQHSELSSWLGKYTFENNIGKTAGGVTAFVDYELILSGKKSHINCVLSESGYQIDRKIICEAKVTKDHLLINFKSFENGSITNAYGVAEYKPGETLFELIKQPDRNANCSKPTTHWKSLKPDGDIKSVGEYFKKSFH